MPGETYLTVSGNLTSDPRGGIGKNGAAWAQVRVARTSRYMDRASNEWRDGSTIFLTVTCFKRLAENVMGSLRRGDRVIVHGRLKQKAYEDGQGNRHEAFELDADAIGADLSRAAVQFQRSAEQPVSQPASAPIEPAAAAGGERAGAAPP